MTCSICGKATGPGAMLCRPCKSALKRARHATVLDFPGTPPMITMPAGFIAPPKAHGDPPRSRTVAARRETGRRVALAVLALVLLATAAYVGRRGMEVDASSQAMVPSPAAVTSPVAAPPPALVTAAEPPAAIGAPVPVARPTPSARVAASRPSPSVRPSPVAATSANPVPIVLTPPVETAERVAEAPVLPTLRAAPAPDRWQLMADALARCATEGGLSGFVCGQRVRIESCDGYWGRVAQCANRPDAPP